jgi:3',5'-cyclic AMP phosphodiesterase CpdA
VTWRLSHISDLHFCATPRCANPWKYAKLRFREATGPTSRIGPEGAPAIALLDSHCPEIAEFLARKLYRMRTQIDLLLISGDIATTGQPEDLRVALRYVTNPQTSEHFGADGNATIRSDAYPIVLMPGNHDRYRTRNAEAGCRTFDLIFQDYWGFSDREISAVTLSRSGRAPLGIVAADFALRSDADATFPSRWMRYGQGYAYRDIVEKLVQKTDALRQKYPGIGVVWVTHFPPTGDSGFWGHRELRFHDGVLAAANDSNIKTILAGHIHERKVIQLGELDIVCAGSGCVFGEDNGNWIHELEIDVKDGFARLTKKVDYQWVDAVGDFAATQ